jgi:hypothetical protein
MQKNSFFLSPSKFEIVDARIPYVIVEKVFKRLDFFELYVTFQK